MSEQTTRLERWAIRADRNLFLAIAGIWVGGGATVAVIIGCVVWVILHA